MRSHRSLMRLLTQIILISLVVVAFQIPALAAGNNCHTSNHPSGSYSVTVCITSPAEGATISGVRNVTATVSTNGTNPGVAKLIFYLGGEYLLTDFQTPFSFDLPTTKWVDGSRLLEVEVLMKDGFISQHASISLTFNNGISQPPVNNNTFIPKSGTTPPSGQSFTLVAAGDGADGATNAGKVGDLIASWNPNLFLYLGDVYEDGTSTEFHNWYGTNSTFFGRFRSLTNPIIGNHEYSTGGVAPGYFDYWDNVPRYYSYDAAGWHFIALDSNCGLISVCAAGQAEYQWLLNDLNTHSNICTIAYFHHPVFNVGSEGYATAMNDMWALMAQHGVDIVLTGHDHDYQRWKPLDGNGVSSPTGITEFVAGGAGHGIQHFLINDDRMVVGFDDTSTNAFGALRLQLNQDGAGFQYINTDGIFLDSGSVTCNGAPADTISPSKPTNLNVSFNDPQVAHLTWNPSTDNVGVTGYSIYRDGSLLKTIGPMTTYDDTTVLPDVTYTYRIRARDAAGKVSSLSDPVTIITPGLLFSDGFEGGDFSQWTSATGLAIQHQQVYAGSYAVRGTSSGTPTYAYEQLIQVQDELYYRLWFKVLSQGANSVYLQRFRTSSNGAIAGIFISNTGKLGYRNDVTGNTVTSTTTITSGIWHELQTRVLINSGLGETEIWLDGTRIVSLSNTENLGNTSIGLIQLGENSTGRTYDIVLDRVALSTNFINPADPPEILPTPTPTSTPRVIPTTTPTATSTPVTTGGTIFADVGINYWARAYIERLYAAGITGGCGTSPLSYCPTAPVTRAQMAIFLLRAEHGSGYAPPAARGTVFKDVPASYWAAAWIEQLGAEGITGGCGSGSYCPEGIVSRDQMAIFLLRAEHGSGYAPPVGSGSLFGDVPVTNWAGAWIEQLVAEGVAAGCGNGNFCPTTSVTRDQMAVFLVRIFHLP